MIESSTITSRVAAFFDLDGTLLPEPSLERRFVSALRRTHSIPLGNCFLWTHEALRLLPKGILAVQQSNKRYLTGLSPALVFRHLETIPFFEEAIARVAYHAQQGHHVVLVSGTLESLAQLAVRALESELEARGFSVRLQICATRLAESAGYWNGRIEGQAVYGPAKAHALAAIAKRESWDLRLCHAYGNSLPDRHLLSAVGHAHAVNPGKELAALANERDWPIWHWYLEKPIAYRHDRPSPNGIHNSEGRA